MYTTAWSLTSAMPTVHIVCKQMEPSPRRARQDPWRCRQRAEPLAGCTKAGCARSRSAVQSAAQLEARQLAIVTAAQRQQWSHQQQRQPEWQHGGQLDRRVSCVEAQLNGQPGWWFPCCRCSSRSPAAAAIAAAWARQQQWRRRRKRQQHLCACQQHRAAVSAASR